MKMVTNIATALEQYKKGEAVYCNGIVITPSYEYGSGDSKVDLFYRGIRGIVGYDYNLDAVKYEVDMKTKQSVKKIKSGKYRVYGVAFRDGTEARYAKKSDADSCKFHLGGQLVWEDFDEYWDAQRYLNKHLGFIWW